MLLIEYPKCTTCQKAAKWLTEKGLPFDRRHIKEQNPSAQELKQWHHQSGLPLKKFFNTSGQLYKQLGLKDKLVKRPILINGTRVLVGFREKEWEELKG